ncbi:PmoA family protein [Algoriphagus limi]|uniref:PmoA family protein n=1 Tax=Algoriphagus limi TaxID=2975273 RepID=A0ABT2G303_9BACT|nr:PmoA family protein [Algoriphagus limi]MCS5489649.1 PmoA family protein [Algoriphagus limi]
MRFKVIIIGIIFWTISIAGYSQSIQLLETDSSVNFLVNDIQVLVYQKSKTAVPFGVDPTFSKSGFIHPLATASGQVLTRIQPEDHYHHYGIWGPWTKTKIQEREVDFWNLGDGKGRVYFDQVVRKSLDEKSAEITVRQNHFDLTAGESPSLAIVENLRIRVEVLDEDRYQVDYISEFTNQLDSSILFESYRYGGGIAFRARKEWGPENSRILTSEGNDRGNSDGAKARWVLIDGVTGSSQGSSGLLILSHPENFDHPEPLRVWPEDSNKGIENVFLNFTPTRFKSWEILAGKTYRLQYRLIVFDGDMKVIEAEEYWKAFSLQKYR